MKKIMFKDKYGLTKAVLEGRKTMTRRMVPSLPPISVNGKLRSIETMYMEHEKLVVCCGSDLLLYAPNHCQPKYKVGEVVAVAQSYKDAGLDPKKCDNFQLVVYGDFPPRHNHGWGNKMFVKADLMPHQIRIKNVRVERLQDISDEDCLREGIRKMTFDTFSFDSWKFFVHNPREAFAALINKISGKGTWQANPYCFCYTFELIR